MLGSEETQAFGHPAPVGARLTSLARLILRLTDRFCRPELVCHLFQSDHHGPLRDLFLAGIMHAARLPTEPRDRLP